MIVVRKDANGVGSNFLRILDWLWCTKYSKDKIHIDWMNEGTDILSPIFDYKNTTPTANALDANHFVCMFHHHLDPQIIQKRQHDISFYNQYYFVNANDRYTEKTGYFYTNPNVYFEEDFHKLRILFNSIYNENFTPKEQFTKKLIGKQQSMLGIHIRYIGHYCIGAHNGSPAFTDHNVFIKNCIDEIKKESENYDKIYIACDVDDIIYAMKEEIQNDKILYHEYNRSSGCVDWNVAQRIESEIVENTFIDMYNLSKCNKFLCSTSNMAFLTLIINPELDFDFLNNLRMLHGA